MQAAQKSESTAAGVTTKEQKTVQLPLSLNALSLDKLVDLDQLAKLKKAYDSAVREEIKVQTLLKETQKKIKDIGQQAQEKFGTSDPVALQERAAQIENEISSIVDEAMHVLGVEL